MIFNWQRMAQVCLLVLLTGIWTGCGGISASHSISPATILIPLLGNAKVIEPYTESEQDETFEEGTTYRS